MSTGRRDLKTDDKSFVAEIARSFHVEKAINRAAKVEKKNNATKAVEGAKKKKKSSSKSGGGTVWITFKGGLSGVPTTSTDTKSAARTEAEVASLTQFRGKLSESRLVAAATLASQYIDSAKQQAAEAGLHYTGESDAHRKKASAVAADAPIDYTEGDKYIKEQQAIAVRPLANAVKSPIGAHMAAIMGTSATVVQLEVPPSFADKAAKEAFEDAVVAQKQLLGGFVDAEVLRRSMYFAVSQHADSQTTGATGKGNTLCLVRCKASAVGTEAKEAKKEGARRRSREEKGKKSTIMFRTKAKADAFVSNFMNNVIRKEMSGAMRIRDGTGMESSTSANPNATNSNTNSSASNNKGGKKGRR